LKIWIKVILAGIILFFVDVLYITAMGGSIARAPEGMVIGMIAAILVAVGILTGLKRGFQRMMNE
jgi:hypothetical protein